HKVAVRVPQLCALFCVGAAFGGPQYNTKKSKGPPKAAPTIFIHIRADDIRPCKNNGAPYGAPLLFHY
ncbi:MAG: hypothetical protein WBK46_17605, partial [Ruminococcus flavefaciens]